jgi:hypothetical protein
VAESRERHNDIGVARLLAADRVARSRRLPVRSADPMALRRRAAKLDALARRLFVGPAIDGSFDAACRHDPRPEYSATLIAITGHFSD